MGQSPKSGSESTFQTYSLWCITKPPPHGSTVLPWLVSYLRMVVRLGRLPSCGPAHKSSFHAVHPIWYCSVLFLPRHVICRSPPSLLSSHLLPVLTTYLLLSLPCNPPSPFPPHCVHESTSKCNRGCRYPVCNFIYRGVYSLAYSYLSWL